MVMVTQVPIMLADYMGWSVWGVLWYLLEGEFIIPLFFVLLYLTEDDHLASSTSSFVCVPLLPAIGCGRLENSWTTNRPLTCDGHWWLLLLLYALSLEITAWVIRGFNTG